jgi:sensor histidine kinase YesM
MIHDKWARIIGIPLISLIIPLIQDFEEMMAFNRSTLRHFIACLVFTTAMWEGNRAIFIYMKRKYAGYQQTRTRIIIQTISSLSYTIIAATALTYLLSLVFINCEFDQANIAGGIITSIIPTLLVTSIYESVYFFEQWKQHIQRSEALARENIQSQLEVLKSQIDPHFLFNSLNTLAALIDDTNEPAQKYLEQLSDVYRYVLLSKDKNTVTLEEELKFVESYIYLIKARFRENVQIDNRISTGYHQYLVPPLTLQMLVENAIKHNVISKDKPLTIRLVPENDDYLTIENNIQEKSTFEKSTKVGLQNIINRYNFLTPKKIQILSNSHVFSVKIPLLAGVGMSD